MHKRDYRLDNIRFLLIFLVVFAHFLELIKGETAAGIYRIIYSFHMPAFLFLTGYFARFDKRKILRSLLCPYLVFQTLYLWFDAAVCQGKAGSLQFTKPYWLLWYLQAALVYHLLLPLLTEKKKRGMKIGKSVATLAVLVAISLLSGFDKTIGYVLSLSRIFCFAPFFYAGYFLAQAGGLSAFYGEKEGKDSGSAAHRRYVQRLAGSAKRGIFLRLFFFAAVCFWSSYIWTHPKITNRILYGSCSYKLAKYGPDIRLMLLLAAACWIGFLLVWSTGKKVPIFSEIGKNTMPIFLLHGFLVKLAKKGEIFRGSETENLLLAAGLSFLLLLLLGNPFLAGIFRAVFGGRRKDNAKGKLSAAGDRTEPNDFAAGDRTEPNDFAAGDRTEPNDVAAGGGTEKDDFPPAAAPEEIGRIKEMTE